MDNTVELLGTYGGDETHALSAWTSTKRELTEEKRNRIDGLLEMLAHNEHHTPFEKSALHFLVKTDIATHIHLLKHRIGVSINAESARYKQLRQLSFYVPTDWPDDLAADLRGEQERLLHKYQYYLAELEQRGHARSRAKESARFILPYASQITSDVMFNFRSFMHFVKLRYDEYAQLEVREVAGKMLQLIRDTHEFDKSLEAFGYA